MNISKKEAKTPDALQTELRKGFEWTTKHSKLVAGIAAVCLLIGGGVAVKSHFNAKTEAELQSVYYKIEKSIVEKKMAFAQAEEAAKAATAKPAAPAKMKKTGDLAADYGSASAELMALIDRAQKSKAAQMAALQLSGLQLEYKKPQDAIDTLSKVARETSDVMSALVWLQLGTVQAETNDCSKAVGAWQKVVANSMAKFLHGDAKLKQALCYESLNERDKAEKIYNELKGSDQNSSVAKTADKYLRLLQASK